MLTLTPITSVSKLTPGIRVLFNWHQPMACLVHGRFYNDDNTKEFWLMSASGGKGPDTFEYPDVLMRTEIEAGNVFKIP